MDKFILTSDSTCDLSDALVKENDIHIIPLTIILGDKQYKDNVDITSADALAYVDKTGNMPKTSAVSIQEYTDFFAEFVNNGYKVLHFDISSEDSVCYSNALQAAKEFNNETTNVYVIDTRQLSTGQGLLIMKAADFRKNGMSIEECYERILSLVSKTRTSFVLDRLDLLHKGGRCSLTTMLAAKILKIHPYISMTDGKLSAKKKYGGSMLRACEQYVTDLAEEYGSYDKTRVFITHCMASDEIVSAVRKKVEELFDFNEIIETLAGTTVSCHCGKNTIGVLFIEE